MTGLNVVTGAFGYSGKYIAQRLLDKGIAVRTLTNSPDRPNPFHGKVEAHPYHFDAPEKLVESLRGATVLYNTYWVRFNYRGGATQFAHETAVKNTRILFDAAKKAGIERIVHVSILNPLPDSPLEYFSGKARLEQALQETGISHAIIRPGVIFGEEDILINNIAWIVRRFPIYPVFGDGLYKLQPIFVDDIAERMVEQGAKRDTAIINAVGPETFTYRGLVTMLAELFGKRRLIVPVPDSVGYLLGRTLGALIGDVVITREEIEGFKANLIYADAPPAGRTKLTDWAKEHKDTLGIRYTSELARRNDRRLNYRGTGTKR